MQIIQSYAPEAEPSTVKQLNCRAGSRIRSVQLLGDEGWSDNCCLTLTTSTVDQASDRHPFGHVRYTVEGAYTISKGNVIAAGRAASAEPV